MSKRTVSGITLTLLFIGMLTLAFNTQTVKASGTIYIRADGSVEPDTAPISSVDNVTYTFTDNIYDEIVVERDNIVVDGVGYTLQGTGSGTGINLTARSNVTIENMEITTFTYGIFLLFSSNNTVSGNNITENDEYGIGLFDYSRYNIISENNITDNWCGIWLFSNYNIISGNNITGNNDHGVHLWCVSNNTVSGNNITANKKSGIYLYRSSDNIISGNNITNSSLGIWLRDSSKNNKFYHNNFVDNSEQMHSDRSTNVWDDGYPSGGNFWSDHVCTGNPSDGTQPYIVDENNIDYYPFQDPNGWLLPPPPPGYTLTIWSSPSGVTFTADNVSHTAPWSRTYGEDASVSLVMPSTYVVGEACYNWSQWSDGNTSRSRTVTMTTNITLTAYYTGPYYELTVTSSPVTGIRFTIDDEERTTPYTEWLAECSYTIEMPETHNGYVWYHWLEDGDPNKTKTITLPGTTWTGVFVFAVQPHGPEAKFEAIPDTALTGESIKFDASASLPGWNGTHTMPIAEYRWDFADGNQTTTTTPIVYHSFSSSGIYYVTLTVYAPGATPDADSTTQKVTITAIPVGGYSFPINPYTTEKPLAFYLALVAILTTVSTAIKRKTHRRTKR